MREPWRYSYTFSTSELIEALRDIRKGTLSRSAGYDLLRETYLQASERGLIKLPEGTVPGNAHLIPYSQVTILNEAINRDE